MECESLGKLVMISEKREPRAKENQAHPFHVDAEWQKYIDENAGIWQPVVDDLNAAFAD